MAEYIKREDVLHILLHTDSVYGAYMSISKIKPADVIERKRGKWIKIKYRSICRDCSFRGFASWNFCPNCGADMRGEQDG